MSLPTTRILLRSPYFVSKETTTLRTIRVDLYVYTGTLTTDKPSNPNYTLTATAYTNSNGNKYAEIDIAPYCRDWIDPSFDFSQSDPSNAVWIEWDLYYTTSTSTGLILDSSSTAVGLDGFSYFEEGYNKALPQSVLLSGNYIVLPTGQDTTIPVLQDNLVNFKLYAEKTLSGGETPLATVTFPGTSNESTDVIYYADTTTGAGTPHTVVFDFSGSIADQTVYLRYNNECRNTPIEVAFINRYGAIQRAWMFGNSKQTLSVTENKYKRNLLTGTGSYDALSHQNSILNKNGTMSVVCNTGFYREESNYIWQEMMLSEKVWLYTAEDTIFTTVYSASNITMPVNVVDTQIQYKNHLDDKLINYTFTFEYAGDRINSVR